MQIFLCVFEFFSNNIIGGDIITYRIYFYWLVGKFVFDKRDCCNNIIEKCSEYLSYYFGDSYSFSYNNLVCMRKFYLCFPVYLDKFENISWKYYLKLLDINNSSIAKFYLKVCLFCDMDYESLNSMINSNTYYRI